MDIKKHNKDRKRAAMRKRLSIAAFILDLYRKLFMRKAFLI